MMWQFWVFDKGGPKVSSELHLDATEDGLYRSNGHIHIDSSKCIA